MINLGGRLNTVSEQLCSTNTRLDATNERLDNFGSMIDSQKSQIATLTCENESLKGELQDVKRSLAAKPNSELKISGIPESVTLDELAMCEAVLDHLQLSRFFNSVLSVRKVKYKETSRSGETRDRVQTTQTIIVQFLSVQIRDFVVAAAKPFGVLNSDVIFPLASPVSKMYVKEFLPYAVNELFHMTKQRASEANYQYTWCKSGVVHTRKENGSEIIQILTERDLDKII